MALSVPDGVAAPMVTTRQAKIMHSLGEGDTWDIIAASNGFSPSTAKGDIANLRQTVFGLNIPNLIAKLHALGHPPLPHKNVKSEVLCGSQRGAQLLGALALGHKAEELPGLFGISPSTADRTLLNMRHKLRVKSRRAAIAAACEVGILTVASAASETA